MTAILKDVKVYSYTLGHVTLTTPHLRVICHPYAGT